MEYVYTPDLWISIADVSETVDAAISLSHSSLLCYKIQRGFPEITQIEGKPVYDVTFDNSKQASILGIKFRTKLETLKIY